MKAIDALTINDEYRLKKESHLANKVLEQEAIKRQLADKDKETQMMQLKYEQDMNAMRQEMNHQFSQIMLLIQQNPGLAHIKPEILSKKTLDMST
jgi:hypothetical protein